jgi:Zn-dependent protease with chaperone function
MSAYQSFLTVLGWSLVNSFWQMAVLWIIYYVLTVSNNRISCAGKHNLILVFAFIGAEWFIYTLIHLMNEPVKPFNAGFIDISSSANSWIYVFSLVYIGILIFRSLQYLVRSQDFRLDKIEKAFSSNLQSFTDRNSRILGVTRRVRVYLSELAETAQTSGFFKPVILLPVSLVTRLSPTQIEAILIHEIFHIRRNDYLINICMSCFRRIFFFNPFAHLFYKALERERELACDDGVIEMGFPADQYAEALFKLEKFRQVQPGFYLAADGNKPWLLMERICRLLGKPNFKRNQFNPLIILSSFTSILLFGLKITTPGRYKEKGQNTVVRVSIAPTEFTSAPMKIVQFEKTAISKRSKQWKSEKVRIPKVAELPSFSEQPDLVSFAPTALAYFTGDKIQRNYSNRFIGEHPLSSISNTFISSHSRNQLAG